ncbi:MAG: AbrB/MazE/SpoVT family DNA-binding domain-containing protein [Gammaproteobacteria bacterium]|nr:AbrB/MazE/SpoVT family DNA-binding domain-containing protein [Gammaproteobacteria bacterium]MYE85943.1 AbrB/MazE/SpoVT family DNA-binding domain-containing protein [Gammaproteobacteria bacterium]
MRSLRRAERCKTARIFMNGRSQAVRLPKEFRFDTDRVAIRREGDNVILSPVYEDWDDYLENAPSAGADFAAAVAEARSSLLPLESRERFE